MKWFNLQDNVNLLSFIGAVAIILLTLIVVGRLFNLMKVKKEEAELTGHTHDGIGEYKNPLPFGWAVVYVILLIWGIWYFLLGYPLGKYSSIGEYNQEVAAHNAKFAAKFANLTKPDEIAMGENIYLVQCSSCHGITADGMNGKAANLNIWGSEEGIYDTIMKGSTGMGYPADPMPDAKANGIDASMAKAIAAYVAKDISAIKKTANPQLVEKGKQGFAVCAACHGMDGKGQGGMAADLAQYGSPAFVVNVLNKGKKGYIGTMPKFDNGILNAIQKKAVGAYVISLSRSNNE